MDGCNYYGDYPRLTDMNESIAGEIRTHTRNRLQCKFVRNLKLVP